MKKLLTLFFMCLAMSVQAIQILWVGINENAIIDFGSYRMTVAEWVNSLEDPELDAGFQIRTDETPLPEVYSGLTDIMMIQSDEFGAGGRWNPFLCPIDVRSVGDDEVIYYDLFQWDYSLDDYKFVATASSNINLLENYGYETFDINPSYAKEWKPDIYYAPVPEPSITILAILGACAMLLKRK